MTNTGPSETYAFSEEHGVAVDPDRRKFRSALGRWPTGVAIATALRESGDPVGITINSLASVSLEPPLILWCIDETATSAGDFSAAGRFAISVLSHDQERIAKQFAWPQGERFSEIATQPGLGGVPLIAGALSVFECVHEAVHPGGDHRIIVGRVERFSTRPGKPLAFHEGVFLGLR